MNIPQAALQDYKKGKSLQAIADAFGFSVTPLREALIRAGIPFRKWGKPKKNETVVS